MQVNCTVQNICSFSWSSLFEPSPKTPLATSLGLGRGRTLQLCLRATLSWSLASKEKLETQRNSEEWACPKAQGRSMTRAIKEQLLLNSFLPRRTILAGGAWLTESSAASDQLPGRQTYLWVPQAEEGIKSVLKPPSMKKKPPSPVSPLFPF